MRASARTLDDASGLGLCVPHLGAARILRQIPHADIPVAVARNELALVRVERNGVDGASTLVFALAAWRTHVPYLDRPVLRAREEPLAVLRARQNEIAQAATSGATVRLEARRAELVASLTFWKPTAVTLVVWPS
mgnify:CR=1 FL=1